MAAPAFTQQSFCFVDVHSLLTDWSQDSARAILGAEDASVIAVMMRHFIFISSLVLYVTYARDKQLNGFARWGQMLMNKRDPREILAYHEAGHAVMVMAFRFHVHSISIRPDATSQGRVQWAMPGGSSTDRSPDAARKCALIAMAGMAADFLHWGQLDGSDKDELEHASGVGDDIRSAEKSFSLLDEGGDPLLYSAIAARILKAENRWALVEFIAATLLMAGGIDGQIVLQRIKDNCTAVSEDEYNYIVRLIKSCISNNILYSE